MKAFPHYGSSSEPQHRENYLWLFPQFSQGSYIIPFLKPRRKVNLLCTMDTLGYEGLIVSRNPSWECFCMLHCALFFKVYIYHKKLSAFASGEGSRQLIFNYDQKHSVSCVLRACKHTHISKWDCGNVRELGYQGV